MQIDYCPKNIRCDTATCNKMAKVCINTSGHKGSLHLCEDCFLQMLAIMTKMKKELIEIQKETKK